MPRGRRFRKGGGLAKKAYRMAKKNSRKIDGEFKFIDLSLTPVVNLAGSITLLSDIDQEVSAATVNVREGDDVGLRSILMRGVISWDPTNPNAAIRMIVFSKNDQNGFTPTVRGVINTSVLQDKGAALNDVLAPLQWVTRRSFHILWDELLIGNPDSVDNVSFKKFIKLRQIASFQSAIGTTAPGKGTLWLLLTSSVNANVPTVTIESRVKFVDN